MLSKWCLLFLTDDTYLNPYTSYLISIFAGEENLIGTITHPIKSSNQSVGLDDINTGSCDLYMMILI